MLSSGSPARDNPFAADDVLIRAGALATIASMIMWVLVDSGLQRVVSLGITLAVLGTGLVALVAGLVLRSRERKAVRLLALVERFPEISVEELLHGSRLRRQDIERAVATVNERGLHYVVWDRRSDTLVDGRLVTGSIVVDGCSECGANVGISVSLANPAAAACPYCKSGVPATAIDELRRSRLAALDAERRDERAHLATRFTTLSATVPTERKRFSIGLFAVLIVIAPPIGMLYGILGLWRAFR